MDKEALCAEIVDKWYAFLTETDEINVPMATEGIHWLYRICGFKPPKDIHITDSPLAAQNLANKLNGDKAFTFYPFAYESLSGSCGWVAYVEMLQQMGMTTSDFKEYKEYMRAGVYAALFFDTTAILVRRPQHIKLNEQKRMHSNDHAAMVWRDGYGLWYLNGIRVPKELVTTPAEQLDPMLVTTEKNAEVRREIVRKIGAERLIQKLKGDVIDTWVKDEKVEYKLITLPIPDMRLKPTYLIMKNPSLGVWHAEGVPQECKTVKLALAWRDGDKGNYIVPEQLT